MRNVIFNLSRRSGTAVVSRIIDSYSDGKEPDQVDIEAAERLGVDVALLSKYIAHVNKEVNDEGKTN